MRVAPAFGLVLALAICAISSAQDPQPGPGVLVSIEFDVGPKVVASAGDEFNISGNVSYQNPSAEELRIDLTVSAGSWEAAISPGGRTVADEAGRFPFVVNIAVPVNGTTTEQVVADGEWSTASDSGPVVPDTFRGIRLDLGGGHDSGPADMVVLAMVGGAAAAGCAAFGYALWSAARKVPPVAPPFYTRLRRQDIEGHEARQEILDRLRASPGMSLSTIIGEVGDPRSTVMYHLRVLEKEGLVRSDRDGRNRLYYTGSVTVHPAFHLEDAIVEAVLRDPGADISKVARELKTSKQLVSYHVQKLQESGRLWVEREGRRKALYPRET